MPALPLLLRRLAAAGPLPSAPEADTRILDARQAAAPSPDHADTLTSTAHTLLDRLPHLLRPRQSESDASDACDAGYVPGCYQNIDSGPAPGAVVGIVLGAVAGFLFLLWLLWILSQGTSFIRSSRYEEEDIHRRRSRSPAHTHRRHRSSHHGEMRASPRERDRIIREERITRNAGGGIPPPRAPSHVRESVIVDDAPRGERRVDGDDMVEVMEEHSSVASGPPPPSRHKSRRGSGYRSVQPQEPPSGYRRVDPGLYGGGDYPQHRVR